jgi:signal transduction histidine kinase
MEISIPLSVILVVFAIAVNTVIAFFVYKNNPKSATNIIYVLLSLVTSIWLALMQVSSEPEYSSEILTYSRLTLFLAVPQSVLFYLLARTLPDQNLSMSKKKLAVLCVSSGIVMALTLTPWVFKDVQIKNGAFSPIIGPGIALFALFATVFSAAAIYTLLRNHKRYQGVRRQQLFFVTFGVFFMLGLIISTILFPVILAGNHAFVPFAPIYVLAFLIPTSYAIIKHRLFDIRFMLARALSFLVLICIIAVCYVIILYAGAHSIFKVSLDYTMLSTVWIFTVVAMLSFQPLQTGFQRLTNRLLFKGQYDYGKLLAKLSRSMAEMVDLDAMADRILEVLLKEMRISKAAFLLIENHEVFDVKSKGYNAEELIAADLENLSHQYLSTFHRFIFEELPDGGLKDTFRKLGISVAIPISVEAKEVAVMVLGAKSSGEVYNDKDLGLLDTFASEAAVAIQNAESFSKLKRFNLELEKRVEQRTKELKESQERELEKAKDVARLKDEFVFIAAHELRTPVAVIMGFLELVSESMKNFPKDIQENLRAIASASDQLNQLINDLLVIARTETGNKMALSGVDLAPVIRSIITEFGPIAGQKMVEMQFHPRGDVPPALVNPAAIKEIISNLISNAIKYNHEGGRVEVEIFSGENNIMLEVRDTGYGIPKDQHEKIFNKFFRAYRQETREVLGTGLGLFITKMLLEKMGGQIEFSSTEHGTTFAVSVPVA